MRLYNECDDGMCRCVLHLDTDTHVPTCSIHAAPLVRGETPGTARCVAVERHATELSQVARRVVGFEVKRCREDWPIESWVWKPRDLFAGEDLPPHNGWLEPELPALPIEGRRW